MGSFALARIRAGHGAVFSGGGLESRGFTANSFALSPDVVHKIAFIEKTLLFGTVVACRSFRIRTEHAKASNIAQDALRKRWRTRGPPHNPDFCHGLLVSVFSPPRQHYAPAQPYTERRPFIFEPRPQPKLQLQYYDCEPASLQAAGIDYQSPTSTTQSTNAHTGSLGPGAEKKRI